MVAEFVAPVPAGLTLLGSSSALPDSRSRLSKWFHPGLFRWLQSCSSR